MAGDQCRMLRDRVVASADRGAGVTERRMIGDHLGRYEGERRAAISTIEAAAG